MASMMELYRNECSGLKGEPKLWRATTKTDQMFLIELTCKRTGIPFPVIFVSLCIHLSMFLLRLLHAVSLVPRLVDLLVPKSTGTSPCLGFLVAESCLGLRL